MKALAAKTGRNGFPNAARRLVAEDNRGYNLLATGARALRHGKRSGGQRGASVDDIPQVAVIGGRRVTHHRIDPGGIDDRQLGSSIKPNRGVGLPAALADEILHDRGGRNSGPAGGTGNRARDQHGRVINGLRGEIGIRGPGEKLGQCMGNGHEKFLLMAIGTYEGHEGFTTTSPHTLYLLEIHDL